MLNTYIMFTYDPVALIVKPYTFIITDENGYDILTWLPGVTASFRTTNLLYRTLNLCLEQKSIYLLEKYLTEVVEIWHEQKYPKYIDWHANESNRLYNILLRYYIYIEDNDFSEYFYYFAWIKGVKLLLDLKIIYKS